MSVGLSVKDLKMFVIWLLTESSFALIFGWGEIGVPVCAVCIDLDLETIFCTFLEKDEIC